jgi:hypothetical protein
MDAGRDEGALQTEGTAVGRLGLEDAAAAEDALTAGALGDRRLERVSVGAADPVGRKL